MVAALAAAGATTTALLRKPRRSNSWPVKIASLPCKLRASLFWRRACCFWVIPASRLPDDWVAGRLECAGGYFVRRNGAERQQRVICVLQANDGGRFVLKHRPTTNKEQRERMTGPSRIIASVIVIALVAGAVAAFAIAWQP